MRFSRRLLLFAFLAAMAAATLLLAGCKEGASPTEPKLAGNAAGNPAGNPAGNIAGPWTGTYSSTDSIECDTNIVYSAQATLWQNGSDVGGTVTATGDPKGCPCGNLTFAGTLKGNALEGTINFSTFSWDVRGTLSGSTLDVALVNTFGTIFGQMHLHR